MAKVLNTLTGYQEALSRKDLVILRLDQRVEELELNVHHNQADRSIERFQFFVYLFIFFKFYLVNFFYVIQLFVFR